MTPIKVAILDRYTPESLAELKTKLNVDLHLSVNEAPPSLSDCEALLIRSQTKVNQSFLKSCNNLKLIVTATSGFDHIDLEGCKKRNIRVAHTPLANAQSAAEHTILLILSALKNYESSAKNLRSGKWKNSLLLGHEFKARRLGIVGLGRVGSRVAKMAQAFGADVCAYDPYVPTEAFELSGAKRLGLTELLKYCDVISLHVPLTSETRHFFRKSIFAEMNTDTILINTSRGEVINEDDLCEALWNRQIAGAALDVFEREPLCGDARILSAPNLTVSPHVGAYTEEAYFRASAEAVQTTIDFFRTGNITNELTVNKDLTCQE